MISLILLYILFITTTGTISLFANKNQHSGGKAFAYTIAAGTAATVFALPFVIHGAPIVPLLPSWHLPFANLAMAIDPLSLLFLIPLLLLSFCSALYGPSYLAHHENDRASWFFFSLLVAGMVLVLISRNALFFLIAWEIMALSSFFLVIYNKEDGASLHAGWLYFVTTHVGTALLIVLFFLLASISGSFDFAAWTHAHYSPMQATTIFVLALLAFGCKAGFIPLHVWLPLAHPAAPSHVSALMSGIMIKMGIYGLLRILTMIGPFHAWWAWSLIIIGAVSAFFGILFAHGQSDCKRLLAYSSIENIGIILMGIGLGMCGVVYGSPLVAFFGFAGSFFHILSHSIFKSLLFLGAGTVISATGNCNLDRLGGLQRSMPLVARALIIGTLALCGLPLFSGFIGELIIYAGGIFGALDTTHPMVALSSITVIIMLGLTGGLTLACLTKMFGSIFLGEPRTPRQEMHHAPTPPMIISMWILAGLCIAGGLGSRFIIPLIAQPAYQFMQTVNEPALCSLNSLLKNTTMLLLGFGCIVAIIGWFVYKRYHHKKQIPTTVTWDCGYTLPDASMQYTGTSFSEPILTFFRRAIGAKSTITTTPSFFPEGWSHTFSVDDWFLSRVYAPLIRLVYRCFGQLQWFQNGKSEQYVLYIAIMVGVLLVWKFLL